MDTVTRTDWTEPPRSVEEAAERIAWWWTHVRAPSAGRRDSDSHAQESDDQQEAMTG